MENESPNLFDSEPVSVKLTVAENPDDVLEEKHENIGNASVDEDAEEDGDSEQRSVVEYRTDDEDDDDVNESADVDRSAERQEDGTASKATAVHKGLPPGRVKLIMKMDPDVNIVAGEAVFLLTKATVRPVDSHRRDIYV